MELTDTDINAFLKRVRDNASKHVRIEETFFMTILQKYRTIAHKLDVKKAFMGLFQKRQGLEAYRKWVIPVHVNDDHWITICVCIREHLIVVYNSMPSERVVGEVDSVRRFLSNFGRLFDIPDFVRKPWVMIKSGAIAEYQQDTVSCGVYACICAWMCAVYPDKLGGKIGLNLEKARAFVGGADVPPSEFLSKSFGLNLDLWGWNRRWDGQGWIVNTIQDEWLKGDKPVHLITQAQRDAYDDAILESKRTKTERLTDTRRYHVVWNGSNSELNERLAAYQKQASEVLCIQKELSVISFIDGPSALEQDPLLFERAIYGIVNGKNAKLNLFVYSHAFSLVPLEMREHFGSCLCEDMFPIDQLQFAKDLAVQRMLMRLNDALYCLHNAHPYRNNSQMITLNVVLYSSPLELMQDVDRKVISKVDLVCANKSLQNDVIVTTSAENVRGYPKAPFLLYG
jgi:hypothetical protein